MPRASARPSHRDLRAQIEQRAQQALAAGQARAELDGRVTIASLRADAANLKAQNRRLRQQITTLEQRLSQALGHQVASELDPDGQEPPDRLRSQLEAADARVFELQEALADAREELEAVREINRELIATTNRST